MATRCLKRLVAPLPLVDAIVQANAAPAYSQSQGLLPSFASIPVDEIRRSVCVLRQVLQDAKEAQEATQNGQAPINLA